MDRPRRGLRLSGRIALSLAAGLFIEACEPSRPAHPEASPAPVLQVGVHADPCVQNPDTWQGNLDAWRANDWGQRCQYWRENAHLPPPSPARIVFIGDSLTENWREADPQLFSNDTLNRGISGQTSEQMLVRFRSDVIDLKPSVVHIMAGTNDVAGNGGPTSLTVMRGNVRSMVEQALSHHIRVVLASILPASHIPWRAQIGRPAETIAVMNRWLHDYAQCANLVFADYTAVLADEQGGMKPGMSIDGVHPAGAGYAAMGPVARAAIARALSAPLPTGPPPADCGVE